MFRIRCSKLQDLMTWVNLTKRRYINTLPTTCPYVNFNVEQWLSGNICCGTSGASLIGPFDNDDPWLRLTIWISYTTHSHFARRHSSADNVKNVFSTCYFTPHFVWQKNTLIDITVTAGLLVMIHRLGLRGHQITSLLTVSCGVTWRTFREKLQITEDVLQQSCSPPTA